MGSWYCDRYEFAAGSAVVGSFFFLAVTVDLRNKWAEEIQAHWSSKPRGTHQVIDNLVLGSENRQEVHNSPTHRLLVVNCLSLPPIQYPIRLLCTGDGDLGNIHSPAIESIISCESLTGN